MNHLVGIVGENIKRNRKLKKHTQESLAEKCGLQVSYLAGVERGERNITIESLDKIINGLEIPAFELFLEIDQSNIYENKNEAIFKLNHLLSNKTEKEINLILNISNEIFKTY